MKLYKEQTRREFKKSVTKEEKNCLFLQWLREAAKKVIFFSSPTTKNITLFLKLS